ncbi:MAG: (deoxy)nucleoside triphosphate pyrophosphohydrolase [Bacteroidales bacterium]
MIDVSCAIIRNEELNVLVVQRGGKTDHPFKWEFPGGKVDINESPEDSVVREVLEELEMEIVLVDTLPAVEHDYGNKQIRLMPFVCDTLKDKPVLNEHIAFRWSDPSDLSTFDFSEADIAVSNMYIANYHTDRGRIQITKEPVSRESGNSDITVSDDELKSMIYRMSGSSEVGWIAASAVSNQLLFRKLLEFTEGDDTRLVFRSSWALIKVCEESPELFLPYLEVIADKLFRTKNGSAERSFLKILQLTGTSSLSEDLQGRLADHCFTLLRSRSSAIAVKVYSIDVLYEISQRYPGLTNELAGILNMLPDDVPAGVKAKCRELLRKLSKPLKGE